MDYTSPRSLLKFGGRDAKQETLLWYSCKDHLWLGNKKLRTHQYRSDLPVLLTASSVAWLHTAFRGAACERGRLCEKLRVYLCERPDTYSMLMQAWLTYSLLDTVHQGRLMLLYTRVCVCEQNQWTYLQLQGCLCVYVCCIIRLVLMSTIYKSLLMRAFFCVAIMSDSSFVFLVWLRRFHLWKQPPWCSASAPLLWCGGRWFTLSGRLVLKGCLGSHRVSQLMGGDGGDRSASHRETDAVKTARATWQNTASTSRAQQIRADHNKTDQSRRSSAARKPLSSGNTSCTLCSNLSIRYRSLSLCWSEQ